MKKVILVLFLVLFAATTFAQEPKTTAAVMDLTAEQGVSESTARMLSDYLRTQLFNTGKFTLVTRENMEQVLKEQKFQLTNCTSQECVVQVGKLLGVRKMFTGSIGKIGATYLITLKIIDAQSGQIERAEKEECPKCEEDALIKSIKNIVDKIIKPTLKKELPENILDQISGKSVTELKADIDSYTKVIELNPKDAEAYYNRGSAYAGLGQNQKAIDNYNKAIELGFTDAYPHRGVTYYNLKEYQKAIDDFTKAIELGLKDAGTYSFRGDACFCLGQHQKAIDSYTKVIELNPKDAEAYYNRGSAYAFLKFPAAACDDFYQAGLLYLNQNQKNQALECVDLIKQTDPSSPLIKKLMDKIYEEK